MGNTSETPVTTNDCQGHTGLLTTPYRFGLFVAPGAGQPSNALALIGIFTNNPATPGIIGNQTPFCLPAPYASGDTITFQVRAWEPSNPNIYVGASEIGQVTLNNSPNPIPAIFGTGPTQIRGFEIRTASCRPNVRLGNTSATPVYTNDCQGNIGLVAAPYRFGFYAAPGPGQSSNALTLQTTFTNNPATPGIIGNQDPFPLPYNFGDVITVQVRAFPLNDVTTILGASGLGQITLSSNSTPSIFGTNAGQLGGFEIHTGSCRELALRRIAPDGPVAITRYSRDGVITWTNLFASEALYKFRVASSIMGPYANYTWVTAITASVTFTNPYSLSPAFPAIEWADAPLPDPVGTWDYQAFDPLDRVMAAGVMTFTSAVPCTVSGTFSRIESSTQYQPVLLHPAGSTTLDAVTVGRSNLLALVEASGFSLRGQMVFDYFAGSWSATSYIFHPSGPPTPVYHGGRFVARRR